MAIDEAHAEAFGYTVHLDERTKAFDTFARCVDVGQDDVEDRVFCYAVSDQRVGFEGAVTAEDAFGSTHSDADAIEASTSPMAVQVVRGKGGIA